MARDRGEPAVDLTAVSGWLRDEGDALVLALHVQPGAKRTEAAGLHGDALKVRLAAPAVDGKANAALVRFLADAFGVARRNVSIVRGENIRTGIPAAQGNAWFGKAAPDLSLIARAKAGGADWVYTYLKSFYVDESRPIGWNNKLFPNVWMPNPLWELQGIQADILKAFV